MKRNYYKKSYEKAIKIIENKTIDLIYTINENIEYNLEQTAIKNYNTFKELIKITKEIKIYKKIYKKYKYLIENIYINFGN